MRLKPWITVGGISYPRSKAINSLFRRNSALGIQLIGWISAALLLLALDNRYAYIAHLRQGIALGVAPVQYIVDWPIKTYQRITQAVASHKVLLDENIQLRYHQTLLEAKLQRLLSLQKENAQLRRLLDYTSENDSTQFLLAELLFVKTNPYRHVIILNRGRKEHVKVGQAVFDAKGVVGQVVSVNELTSTVMLITDPHSTVPVKIARTGERAMVRGMADLHQLALINLPRTSTIRAGDVLLTSGLGKRFPEGSPLGKVIKVTKDAGEEFIRVEVKPIAQFDKSRLMLLTHLDEKESKIAAELAHYSEEKNYKHKKA